MGSRKAEEKREFWAGQLAVRPDQVPGNDIELRFSEVLGTQAFNRQRRAISSLYHPM